MSEKIHTHPTEGHLKFLLGEGGGSLKPKFWKQSTKFNWNFFRGGGCKTKNLPLGEYGYFLELHIVKGVEMLIIVKIELHWRLAGVAPIFLK